MENCTQIMIQYFIFINFIQATSKDTFQKSQDRFLGT